MSDSQPKQVRPQLGTEGSNRGAKIFILALVLINVIGITMARLFPWLNQYFQ